MSKSTIEKSNAMTSNMDWWKSARSRRAWRREMARRTLSVMLSVSMVLSGLPTQALAEAIGTRQELVASEVAEATGTDVTINDDGTVTLGTEEASETYEPAVWDIVFDPNGGEGAVEPVEGVRQDLDVVTIAKPEELEYEGHHLLGWATTKDNKSVPDDPDTEIDETVRNTFVPLETNLYNLAYNYIELTDDDVKEIKDGTASGILEKYGPADIMELEDGRHVVTVSDALAAGSNADDEHEVKSMALVDDVSAGGECVLYAVWEADTYRVVYDANGGEGTMRAQRIALGEQSELRENEFTRDGYEFVGWALDPDATWRSFENCEVVSDLCDADGDEITLYALWEQVEAPASDGLEEEEPEESYADVVQSEDSDAVVVEGPAAEDEQAAEESGDKAASNSDEANVPADVLVGENGGIGAARVSRLVAGNAKIAEDEIEKLDGIDAPVKREAARLLASSRGAGVEVEGYERSADGSNIESIDIEWTGTEQTNWLQRPADNTPVSFQAMISYALSGEHDYEPGDITITIPAYIFENRDGSPVGIFTSGCTSYEQDPSKATEFNWSRIDDTIVFTNTRRMDAAQTGVFTVSYKDIKPSSVLDRVDSDALNATINVTTHRGNTIALATRDITGSIDTFARLTNGEKHGTSMIVPASSVPESQRVDGEENYVAIKWSSTIEYAANQPNTIEYTDTLSDEYDGFIGGETDETPLTTEAVVSNGFYVANRTARKSTSLTSYYPFSQFDPDVVYTFHNTITWTVTENDPEVGSDPQAVTTGTYNAEATFVWHEPSFGQPTGHFMVNKDGNDGPDKGYITRNPTVSKYTTMDTNVHNRDGYYGVYRSALNQLKDGSDVEITYTTESIGYMLPWTLDGDPRVVSNYGKRPVTMVTYDTDETQSARVTVWDDRGTRGLQLGQDYELVAVEFPKAPNIMKARAINLNPDGSFASVYAGDGTVDYQYDENMANIPPITLEAKVGDNWVKLATLAWNTGSLVVTPESGVETDGIRVYLPEGTEQWRTTVTSTNAELHYYVRTIMNIKADGAMGEIATHAFEGTAASPTVTVGNTTRMEAYDADGNNLTTIKKIGYDHLSGYTTKIAVRPSKTARYTVNKANRQIVISYSAEVSEKSYIDDRHTYDEAVADGLLKPETSGVWYDLLPRAVTPQLDTIRLRSGDTVTDAYTVENWRDTGRTLLVVKCALTPKVTTYKSTDGSTSFYQDVPTISFDATYDMEDYMSYGSSVHNVIAFESLAKDKIGDVVNYSGEPDTPYSNGNVTTPDAFINGTEKSAMRDLDPDRNTPSFVYAGVQTVLNMEFDASTSLHKDVQVNNDGRWSQGTYEDKRTVYEGGTYSYRLRMMSSAHTTSKNMRLMDSLENYYAHDGNDDVDIDAPRWRGTLVSVDMSQLEGMGCAPVLYYSTVDNLLLSDESDPKIANATNTDLSDTSIWVRADQYQGDLADVHAFAIDASKDRYGNDFELHALEQCIVTVKMQAPSGAEATEYIAQKGAWGDSAHAYNNAYLLSTSLDDRTGTGVDNNFIRNDYTKVGLMEYNVKVRKLWDDGKNRDGLRTESVSVNLLADGEPTKYSATLSNDNNWTHVFEHLPYTTPGGDRIHYSIQEISAPEGYATTTTSISNNIIITNTHEPETLDISGEKTWSGDDDATRPEAIVVELVGNGKVVERRNVRPDADGSWRYEFENVWKNENGQPITYTVRETGAESYASTVSDFDIDNTYHPYGNLWITKSAKNVTEGYRDRTYQLLVEFEDAEGNPLEGSFEWETTGGETGTVESGGIIEVHDGETVTVKELPEYSKYRVQEIVPDGFTARYAGQEGTITPNVPQESGKNSATVTNTYHAETFVNLRARKQLEGRELLKNQFRFQLLDEDGNLLRGGTNEANGNVVFGALGFTEADAGKTYRYQIVETNRGRDGYTYDDSVYTATVHLEDNGDGTMTPTVTYADAEESSIELPLFENSYHAEGSIVLRAWKQLAGGRNLRDGEFTFELVDEQGHVLQSKTNDAKGNIVFDAIEYDEKDAGKVHNYVVREVAGSDNTIIYDKSTFGYAVTVVDNGDGTLTCSTGYASATPIESPLTWDVASDQQKDELVWRYRGDDGYVRALSRDASSSTKQAALLNEVYGRTDIAVDDIEVEGSWEHGFYLRVTAAAFWDYEIPRETYFVDDDYTEIFDNNAEATTAVGETYVSGYQVTSDGTETMPVFKNKEKPGNLSITKSVTYATPEEKKAEDFTFRVKLTGPNLPESIDYELERYTAPRTLYATGCDAETNEEIAVTVSNLGEHWPEEGDITLSLQEYPNGYYPTGRVHDLTTDEWIECETWWAPSITVPASTTGVHEYEFELEKGLTGPIDGIFDGTTESGVNKQVRWKLDRDGVLTIWPTNGVSGTYVVNGSGNSNWGYNDHRSEVTKVVVAPGVKIVGNTGYMFNGMSNATEMDVSGLDVSGVTTTSYMFQNCSSLEELDVSTMDLGRVEQMNYMFAGCSGLDELDLSECNINKATNISSMVYGCDLTTLDVSGMTIPTSSIGNLAAENLIAHDCVVKANNTGALSNTVKNADFTGSDFRQAVNSGGIFANRSNLETLVLKDCDLSYDQSVSGTSPQGLYRLCDGCSSLTSVDLRGVKLDGCANASYAFRDCSNLETTSFGELDVSDVTNMSGMFSECSALESLDLSGWDTSSVTNMGGMFNKCSALESLDLSGWDTSNVTSVGSMFYNCTSLRSVTLGAKITSNIVAVLPDGEWTNGSVTYSRDDLAAAWSEELAGTWTKVGAGQSGNGVTASVDFLAFGRAVAGLLEGTVFMPKVAHAAEADVTSWTDWGECEWGVDDDGCLWIRPKNGAARGVGAEPASTTSYLIAPWRSRWTDIKSVRVPEGKTVVLPAASNGLFYNCTNMTYVDATGFDTSNVTNMRGMFNDCYALESIDGITGWNTSNVTNMRETFYSCNALESLDLSSWNTGNVTNMGNMFSECKALEDLDLSGWDTSNVTDMHQMFSDCRALDTVDLSGWDFSGVTSGYRPFGNARVKHWILDGCTVTGETNSMLTGNAYVESVSAKNADFQDCTSITSMFYGCGKLETVDLSGMKGPHAASMYNMFGNCTSLTDVKFDDADTSGVTDMSNMFSNCTSLESLDLSGWDTSSVTNMSFMFDGCTSLAAINGITDWNTGSVTNMYMMFQNCTSLEDLDLSGWDTTSLRQNAWMFCNCSALESLDLSGWDTSRVTTMNSMFYGCTALDTVDLSGWDFSGVKSDRPFGGATVKHWILDACTFAGGIDGIFSGNTYVESVSAKNADFQDCTSITSMFYGCGKLETVDLSGMKGPLAASMSYMFSNCTSLTDVNLENVDTSGVTNMSGMFYGCSSLVELDLGDFDTSHVTNMSGMFYGCSSLVELDLGDFDTSHVTNMSAMFQNCSSIENLDLSAWDTSSVTDMYVMFQNCPALENIDLSGWDTSHVTNMSAMFHDCTSLTELDLSDFDTSRVTNMGGMFVNVPLEELKLGELTLLQQSASLRTPPETAPYNGLWLHLEDGDSGTAEDVMSNVMGAGTYVWDVSPKYFVTYDPNGGVGTVSRTRYMTDEQFTIAENGFTYFDHEFVGWNTEADGSGTDYQPGQDVSALGEDGQTVTLYAQWQQREHTVELEDGEFEVTVPAGATLTLPNLPAGTSYQVYEQTKAGWVLVGTSDTTGTIAPTETAEARFTNDYQPKRASVQIVGTKLVDGTGERTEGAWSFQLVENGEVIQTVTNGAGGAVAFEPITYSKPGTHHYTVREIDTGNEDYVYDHHVARVDVEVTETDGKLAATVRQDEGDLTFENATKPSSLKVQKSVTGATAASEDDTFTFTVRILDAQGNPVENAELTKMPRAAAAGNVVTGLADVGRSIGRGLVGIAGSLGKVVDAFGVSKLVGMVGGLFRPTIAHAATRDVTVTFDAGDGTFEGGSSTNVVTYDVDEVRKVVHTANVTDSGTPTRLMNASEERNQYRDVTIPGANQIHIDLWYGLYYSSTYAWLAIYDTSQTPTTSNYSSAAITKGRLAGGGSYNSYAKPTSSTYHKTYDYHGNSARFYLWMSTRSGSHYGYGYHAVVTGDVATLASGQVVNPVPAEGKIFKRWVDNNGNPVDTSAFSPSQDMTLHAEYVTPDLAGKAYAILDDAGNMTLFRSHQDYQNGYVTTVEDLQGNAYTGRCFAIDEDATYTSYSQVPWYSYRNSIKTVQVAEGQTIKPKSTAYWFYGCAYLKNADLRHIDTSLVTSMNYMFYSCNNAAFDPDMSGWDTSHVTSMSYMFGSCYGAAFNPDVSGWDTGSVTDMSGMFSSCYGAAFNPDVSSWDTSNVTYMNSMFNSCYGAAFNPDLSDWDTGSVTNMQSMFYSCRALESLDLSGWDTSSVTNMGTMFYNCTALESLDLSGWDTSRVSSAASMFTNDNALRFITLGEGYRFPDVSTAYLPTPNDVTSVGKWHNPEKETAAYTPQELAGAYDGSDALRGTWTWYHVEYDVAYDANGGAGTMANEHHTYGESFNVKECTYSNPGYDFVGWNTADDGTGMQYAANQSAKNLTNVNGQTVTLYAQWTDKSYDVIFDRNGAWLGRMDKQHLTRNNPDNLLANEYVRPGYEFAGWNTAADGTGTAYVNQEQVVNLCLDEPTITLYAQWARHSETAESQGDGLYTVTLKGGESLVFEGLPAGSSYEVVENDAPNGWSLESSQGTTGQTTAGTEAVASFTNTYSTYGEATIQAWKHLEGREPKSGQFAFELLNANGEVLERVENGAATSIEGHEGDAPITFSPITFDQEGSWTYTIREVPGDDQSVEYDGAVKMVTVTATDKGGGRLGTTVSYGAGQNDTFTNIIKSGELEIEKIVTKSSDAAWNKSFLFDVSLFDENGQPIPIRSTKVTTTDIGGTESDTIADVNEGKLVVALSDGQSAVIRDLPDGTSYSVVEREAEGWTNTAKNGDEGTIVAGETATATFENEYHAAGSFSLAGTKRVIGNDSMKEDAFTFTLLDPDGIFVAEAHNKDDGSIVFDNLPLEEDWVGTTRTYSVSEVAGEDSHYVYDEHVESIEVTTRDDGQGHLSAEVAYDGDGMTFENTYKVPLPKTGGDGTVAWVVGACGITIASLAAWLRRKRKRMA